MVRLYKTQFGRGPTAARTHWCGPDALSCFLEDTLTPAERKLALFHGEWGGSVDPVFREFAY